MRLPGATAMQLLPLLLIIVHIAASQHPHRRMELRLSANWRSPANWRSGAPPCPRDSARLPARCPALVGVAAPPLTVRDLRLPRDGRLVLFEGAGLRAFDEAVDGCARGGADIRDAAFNHTQPLHWFQPSNWRSLGADDDDHALPIDRLPGGCDTVVFEPSTSYFVEPPTVESMGEPAPVAQIEIAGRTFNGGSSGDFQAYWSGSEFARAQFYGSVATDTKPPPPVRLSDCDPALGEIAQALQLPGLMARVCGHSSCRPEAATACGQPISAKAVAGACCDLCGAAAVWLRPAGGRRGDFDLRQLRARLAGAVKQMTATLKASRMSLQRVPSGSLGGGGGGRGAEDPLYQLVVVADGGGQAAVDDVVKSLESWAVSLHYTTVKMLRSGIDGARTSGLSGRLATGWVAGLTVFLLLAAVVTLGVVARAKGWCNPPDLRKAWLAWRQRRHQQLQEERLPAGVGEVVDFSSTSSGGAVSFQPRAARQAVFSMAFTNPVFDEVSQPKEPLQEPPVEDHEL